MVQQEKFGDTGKGGRRTIVIAVVAIVVIAVLIGIIVYLLHREEPQAEAPEESQRNTLVTEDNVEDILADAEEVPEADHYNITMNTTWYFPDGASESTNSYVENETENTTPVYFDIFLAGDEDDGEPIYASPVLPVGTSISKFKLDKVLENGTYDCVMVYHLVDDDQNTLSTVNVAMTINIGN